MRRGWVCGVFALAERGRSGSRPRKDRRPALAGSRPGLGKECREMGSAPGWKKNAGRTGSARQVQGHMQSNTGRHPGRRRLAATARSADIFLSGSPRSGGDAPNSWRRAGACVARLSWLARPSIVPLKGPVAKPIAQSRAQFADGPDDPGGNQDAAEQIDPMMHEGGQGAVGCRIHQAFPRMLTVATAPPAQAPTAATAFSRSRIARCAATASVSAPPASNSSARIETPHRR